MKRFASGLLIGLILGFSLMAIPGFSRDFLDSRGEIPSKDGPTTDFLGPDGELYYKVGPTMMEKVFPSPARTAPHDEPQSYKLPC